MSVACPKCRHGNPAETLYCGRCGTQLPAASGREDLPSSTRTLDAPGGDLARGTVFAGRFEIIEELGAGGMGRIYRAFDKKLDEEVALKFLKPAIAADKRTVERFRNEIRVARKIRHDHVCAVHDLHEEAGTLFITMEYVRGEDLKSLIRRTGRLTAAKAISIGRQVAEGLTQAHKLGVVHRDLKPANIMIDKDGKAKIMDFGIARTLTGAGTTVEGAIIGTPEYMSPEQVDGKPADARADIYALGAILFEMAAGRPPFEGETAFSVANKHKSEPPPDPRTLIPELPAALGRLILRCLEKEREARYQTAGEIATELEAVEASLPAAEYIPGRVPSRTKPRTSREITVKLAPRRLILPAAALAAALAAVILWHPWRREGGPPAFPPGRPSLAVLNFANRTGRKDFDDYRYVIPDSLGLKLNQSKYLVVIMQDQVNSILTRLGLLETDSFTRENLRAIGRAGLIEYLAFGHFSMAGERIQLRLTVQEAESGKLVGSEEVQGESIESLWSMVDELALKIKPALEVTAVESANDIDTRFEGAYTNSLEAYMYWIKGTRLGAQGKFKEASEMHEKAVALDPEFAMAYRSLGMAYQVTQRGPESWRLLYKAVELANTSDRLPLRDKLTILGGDPRPQNRKIRIEALTRLLEEYPEDLRGNAQFAMYWADQEEWEKAAERAEVPVKRKTENISIYRNLAGYYGQLGAYDKAEDLLKGYIRDFPNSPSIENVRILLARVYAADAKYKPASDEAEIALRSHPSFANEIIRRRGEILHLQGEFDAAEAEFRKLLSENNPQLNIDTIMDYLVPLYLAQGMYSKAREAVDQAIVLATGANLTARLPLLKYVLMDIDHSEGNFDAEEALLDELWKQAEGEGKNPRDDVNLMWPKTDVLTMKKLFKEAEEACFAIMSYYETHENKKLLRIPFLLQGNLASEAGDQERAIERLSKAVSLLPPGQGLSPAGQRFRRYDASFLYPLALAYFRAGDLEKARREYEEITRMTYGRYLSGDLYAKSFHMLGQVYERLGNKKQARANYQKFLDLWKNADPGRPEVEDAKKRLAAL